MDESFSVLLAAGYRKMTERKPRVEKAFEQFDPDGFGYTAEIHGSRGSSTRTFVGGFQPKQLHVTRFHHVAETEASGQVLLIFRIFPHYFSPKVGSTLDNVSTEDDELLVWAKERYFLSHSNGKGN